MHCGPELRTCILNLLLSHILLFSIMSTTHARSRPLLLRVGISHPQGAIALQKGKERKEVVREHKSVSKREGGTQIGGRRTDGRTHARTENNANIYIRLAPRARFARLQF